MVAISRGGASAVRRRSFSCSGRKFLKKRLLFGHCRFMPGADKPFAELCVHGGGGAVARPRAKKWVDGKASARRRAAERVFCPCARSGLARCAARLRRRPRLVLRQVRSQSAEIAAFYRARDGAPLWLSPNGGSRGAAAHFAACNRAGRSSQPQTLQCEGLSAERSMPLGAATRRRSQRADAMLSAAFVAYARDQRHDPRRDHLCRPGAKPTPPSAAELLDAAAHAPSLSDYVQNMGWMNPIYAKLRAGDREPALPKRHRAAPARAQPRAGAGAACRATAAT